MKLDFSPKYFVCIKQLLQSIKKIFFFYKQLTEYIGRCIRLYIIYRHLPILNISYIGIIIII